MKIRQAFRIKGVSRSKHTVATVGVFVAFLGGMVLLSGHDNLTSSARDADGYIMFEPAGFERSSAAIIIEDIDVLKGRFRVHADDAALPDWAIADLDVRMRGSTNGPGPLFIGIAPSSDVDAYLAGVAHDEISDVELDVADVRATEYTTHDGTATPGAPGAASFWETSVEGTGLLTLDWTVRPGSWTAVIMNADAAPGVTTELVFGAKASNVGAIGWTKMTIGFTALVAGGLVAFFALRRREPQMASTALTTQARPSSGSATAR